MARKIRAREVLRLLESGMSRNDRVAKCGVRETRHRDGLRPRISFDQEKDSRERRPQWTLYSKTRSR